MDCETFNYLSGLEQVAGVLRALGTSVMQLFAKLVTLN